MFSLKKISLIFSCLFCISCSSNLDFNQIKEYSIAPVVTSSLAYFTVLPAQFFDASGNLSITERTDISEFRIFDNKFFKENLQKIDFDVEIINEFDGDFLFEVDFLDDNNNITHKFSDINVDAKNLNYIFKETIELSISPNLINTTRVRITIKIINSPTLIDLNDTNKLDFKSATTIYLKTNA